MGRGRLLDMGRPASTPERLTERQREVMELVARGRTNGEIAEALGISLDGAKWHVSELLMKFDVATREELIEAWESRPGPITRGVRWLGGLALWQAKWAAAAGLVAVGAVVAAGVILAVNQFGDEDVPAAADPTATHEATVSPSPSASPRPTSTPGPITGPVPSTVQVINVATGDVTTLYEELDARAWIGQGWPFGFAEPVYGDVVMLWVDGAPRFVTLDGDPAQAPAEAAFSCWQNLLPIEPRPCGPEVVREDGERWFVYEVENGEFEYPGGFVVPMTDLWVANPDTGQRVLLQEGLVPCGGCDGRYGPEWSPSGRYLTFTETGGDGRRFLADVESGETRLIGYGSGINFRPNWAPERDHLVYALEGHLDSVARFEDLETGEVRDLALPWPVEFDASGTVLYSSAWGEAPKDSPGETVLVDAATGEEIARLSGAVSSTLLWTGMRGVGQYDGGYVAVLQRSAECDGTVVYRDGEAAVCVAGGEEGHLNGDGSKVVVARVTGKTGHIESPGLETIEAKVYALDVVDVETGAVTTVLEDVVGISPPLVYWHEDGEHLVVSWPGTGMGL